MKVAVVNSGRVSFVDRDGVQQLGFSQPFMSGDEACPNQCEEHVPAAKQRRTDL